MKLRYFDHSDQQEGGRMDVVVPRTSNELAAERTDMATVRTLMAADRTLMAWIRTSLSMLSFGFTVYKFLLYVRESLSDHILRAQGPRRFGIVLITLGTMSMLFGLIDYYGVFKQYGETSGRSPWSPAFYAGLLTFLLGLSLLVSIVIHREVF
jgi:putative membrane protein